MKNILPLFLISFVIIGGFFYYNTINNSNIKNNINNNDFPAKEEVVLSGENLPKKDILHSNPNILPLTSTQSTFQEKFSAYQKNRKYFDDVIENNDILEVYNYQGLDTYPQLFYLCSIFEKSIDERALKTNLMRGKSMVLLSPAYTGAIEAYGGITIINLYNQTILDYAEKGIGSYSDFYTKYKASTDTIFASDASDYVKRLGEVIVAIYGLGKEKFVDKKTLDCSKDMEKLLEGKNLNP